MPATVVRIPVDPSTPRCGTPNDLKQMIVDSLDGMRKSWIKTETLVVTDAVQSLPNIPANARGALITLEASLTTTDFRKACRLTEGGLVPTAAYGLPIGDSGIRMILSRIDLLNFKIIGIEAGLTHQLNIKYVCVDGQQS